MNLLKHYIIEVLRINELQHPGYLNDPIIEVQVLCDCWGNKRIYNHLTTRSGWQQELKQGYFMA